MPARSHTEHEEHCEQRSVVCDREPSCGLRVYPNKPPPHNCVSVGPCTLYFYICVPQLTFSLFFSLFFPPFCSQSLKARVQDLSGELEQQRVDFEERLSPYRAYVKEHESGNYVTWSAVRAGDHDDQVRHDSFHTTKVPKQLESPSQPAAKPAFARSTSSSSTASVKGWPAAKLLLLKKKKKKKKNKGRR